jgi:ribosomal protein S18 acetylase RimI-like enzyme
MFMAEVNGMINKYLEKSSEYIKEANIDDIGELSRISNSLLKYLFEKDAPKWFVDDISPKSFEERLVSDDYAVYIYIIEDKIAGFISIKNQNQIFHLFVDSVYHKKGIAKKLWGYTKAKYDIKKMKVNSSLYAKKIYESFGFVKDGEEKEFNGLKYQPMILI